MSFPPPLRLGPAGAPAGPGRVKSGRSRAAERAFARPVFSSPARLAQNGPGKSSCPGPAVSELGCPQGPKKERKKEMGQPRSQNYVLESREIEIVTSREGR